MKMLNFSPGDPSSDPVPIVRADQITLGDPDFSALHSAKTKPEAKLTLTGQAEAAIIKPRSLLQNQAQEYTKLLAEAQEQLDEALKALESTQRRVPAQPGSVGIRWPESDLEGLLVGLCLVAGLSLTGLGWWNSAHICMIFMQDALLSFGFTAPLLFLPVAVHLVTKQLGLRSRFLLAALGAMAVCGAFLLVVELAGAAKPSVDIFEPSSTGPNPLRLLFGQVLLEIASGVLLIQQAEKKLHCEFQTVPNEVYEEQSRLVERLKLKRDSPARELALVQAELKALEAKATDWIQRHLLRWEDRAA